MDNIRVKSVALVVLIAFQLFMMGCGNYRYCVESAEFNGSAEQKTFKSTDVVRK